MPCCAELLATLTHSWGGGTTLSHSAAAASLIGLQLRGTRLTLRQQAYLLLEEPSSSGAAHMLSLFIGCVTLLSAAATTSESIHELADPSSAALWLGANFAFNIFFTAEAFVRVLCYEPTRAAALHDAFIWLDVLTILPFWLRVGCYPHTLTPAHYLISTGNKSDWLRLVEACASLRLLKLCRCASKRRELGSRVDASRSPPRARPPHTLDTPRARRCPAPPPRSSPSARVRVSARDTADYEGAGLLVRALSRSVDQLCAQSLSRPPLSLSRSLSHISAHAARLRASLRHPSAIPPTHMHCHVCRRLSAPHHRYVPLFMLLISPSLAPH
jgi:hypothetical protein